MQLLDLPHKKADYLCPVNGLCDIYEWKTGNRIPEKLLFFSGTGFMLISNKRAISPKMIFIVNGNRSIGGKQYNFWKSIMGYEIISAEGKSFKSTLSDIKGLIDTGIPVILFGLDMYHLPYLTKFYHKTHIPGHIVLMIGYDERNVYIHDNSKDGVKKIPFEDLCAAWENGYIGISKKNAYFGINFNNPNHNMKDIIQKGLTINANSYFNPPVGFMGIKGIEKIIKEFPEWCAIFDDSTLCDIYKHFITYTGSVLPELPEKLGGFDTGIKNPHRGSRDQFAMALIENKDTLGTQDWENAANAFQESGKIMEKIVNGFTNDIINHSYTENKKYIELFSQLKQYEEKAHSILIKGTSKNL